MLERVGSNFHNGSTDHLLRVCSATTAAHFFLVPAFGRGGPAEVGGGPG